MYVVLRNNYNNIYTWEIIIPVWPNILLLVVVL